MSRSSIWIKLLKGVVKSAPIIFSIAAGIGTVETAVQAVKASEQPIDISDHEETKTEIAIGFVKRYKVPLTIGAATVLSIGAVNYLYLSRERKLTRSIKILEKSLDRYIRAATATLGVEGTKSMNNYMLEHSEAETPKIPDEDDGKSLFYDPYYDYKFRVSKEDFAWAVCEVNQFYAAHGYCNAKFFYDSMGIETPSNFNNEGWLISDNVVTDWEEMAYFVNISYDTHTMDDGLEWNYVQYGEDYSMEEAKEEGLAVPLFRCLDDEAEEYAVPNYMYWY